MPDNKDISMSDKQPLLTPNKTPAQQVGESLRQATDSTLRDAISGRASNPPSRTPSVARTSSQAAGAPNFISSVIPLFGMIALSTIASFILGRWAFSMLWILFIMYGVWEVVRRRVERFELYHRNRIDREIAKERLVYHMETCEWINHIVDRFWSVVEPVASSIVIDKANQALARSCPMFLDSIQLTEFTLGSSAPHILGAKVYPQTGSDIIHLDLDLCFVPNEIVEHDFIPRRTRGPTQWNSRIVLTGRVGRGMIGKDIPIEVKEIMFYGRLRAQVQLAASIPFVQSVEIGFLEQPKINFILKPLIPVDIMDVPGLSKFLFSMINTNVAKFLVDPNKITINVAEILKKEKRSRMNSVGVLRVKVFQTRGLKDPEDTTVRVSVAGRLRAETLKYEKDEDGWNEVHYVLVSSIAYPVTFSLVGSSLGLMSSNSDIVGSCKVSIENVAEGGKSKYLNIWKDLTTRSTSKSVKKAPELNVGVEYFPAEYIDSEEPAEGADKKAEPAAKELPKYRSGILQITLHGAKDLPAHSSKKDWTTFMEASISNCLAEDAAKKRTDDDINPYTFRSTTKKNSNAPSWEETFEFMVVDYEKDEITMKLRDAKDDHPLGNLCKRVKDLLDASNWFSLSEASSGKVYLSTVFKPVNIVIDDPSSLKYAPSVGVVMVNVKGGSGFKKRNELQGKQEYYVDLTCNGRSVRKTRTVKTMENPVWNEHVNVFIKADTDQLVLKLFEENNLLKDSGEGIARVDLAQLMATPGAKKDFAAPLDSGKHLSEEQLKDAEKLLFDAAYYPVGTLKLSEPNPDLTMIQNGVVEEESNSGILELRTVTLHGMGEKEAGKMKLSCNLSLSSSSEDIITTKTVRAQGIDNRFTWELFTEQFVIDYSKTSLWLVFTDSSGLMADATVASISIPVALLHCQKEFAVPSQPALRVTVNVGQYRGMAGVLAAPVENSGLLKLDIVRASVIAVDSGGTSDPFVTVKLNHKTVFKTKVVKKTVAPEWRESVQVRIDDRRAARLLFEVTDWNQVMMSEPLGRHEMDLLRLEPDKLVPVECKLQGVPTGTLWLNMFYETNAGKSAAGTIGTVPVAPKSESLVGSAADVTKGAAGVVTGVTGSVAGHTAGATKAVAHGAASAVTSTASAMKSGMTSVGSVFGLKSKEAPPPAAAANEPKPASLENDLKFTIGIMTASPEIKAFDCTVAVSLDGKERLHRTKTIKQSRTPDWQESFQVTTKQVKHARSIEFVPESNLSLEALGLSPGDKPVFRLDLSRPELGSVDGTDLVLFLNDREDDPPLTLRVSVVPVAPATHHQTGIGKMFGKVKFGR